MFSPNNDSSILPNGSFDRIHTDTDRNPLNGGTAENQRNEHSGLLRPLVGAGSEVFKQKRTRRFYFLFLFVAAYLVYQLLDAVAIWHAKAECRTKIEDARKVQKTTERDAVFEPFFDPIAPPYEPEQCEPPPPPIWVKAGKKPKKYTKCVTFRQNARL